jgi:hypothetical protein
MAVGRTEKRGAREQGGSKGTEAGGLCSVVSDKKNRKRGREKSGADGRLFSQVPEPGPGVPAAVEKPKRRWRGNGVKRLRQEVDRVVAEHSEELAKVLFEDAKKGRMQSARLLVALSEQRERPKKRGRRTLSVADRLAAEPEWDFERDGRHGGLTLDDLPGSEECWRSESFETLEQQE